MKRVTEDFDERTTQLVNDSLVPVRNAMAEAAVAVIVRLGQTEPRPRDGWAAVIEAATQGAAMELIGRAAIAKQARTRKRGDARAFVDNAYQELQKLSAVILEWEQENPDACQ